jgi:hypothetical protein
LAARASAPARSSSAATPPAFFSAALCSGVTPTRLAAQQSAPADSSSDATPECPRSAVQCSAVQPPCATRGGAGGVRHARERCTLHVAAKCIRARAMQRRLNWLRAHAGVVPHAPRPWRVRLRPTR